MRHNKQLKPADSDKARQKFVVIRSRERNRSSR